MTFEMLERQAICDVHGSYTEQGSCFVSTSEPHWFGCGDCRKAEELAAEQKQAESAARRRVWEAGIPPRHLGSTFKGFETKDAESKSNLVAVKGWVDRLQSSEYDGAPLTLIGAAGRGKTHLACAALGLLTWRGRFGAYITAIGIERLARDFESGSSRRTQLERVGVLVLDELGLEARGDFVRSAVSALLHARYDALLPTIVASNLDAAGITDIYGQGIADRYVRDSFVVKFTGRSQRGAKPLTQASRQSP